MRRPTLPQIILLSSTLLVLPSCDSEPDVVIEADPKVEELNEKPGVRAKMLADLVEHDNGTFTYKGDLFSGRAVKLAEDGSRIFEKHFWEGRMHGSSREFYTDGSVRSDIRFEDGVANGIAIEFDPDGKRSEIFYEDGVEVERHGPEKEEETGE